MKLRVDQDKCIACGACVAIAPNNFDFNDDGLSTVIGDGITDETRNAIDACPVYAIAIEEENLENEVINTCKCENECTCDDECNCENECTCDDECNCNENISENNECKCEHCHCEDLEEAA